jgi:abhydrolase domain-containing protein 12
MDQEFIFDLALGDPEYDTIVYFHGNALHRAAPWRIDLYKVCV